MLLSIVTTNNFEEDSCVYQLPFITAFCHPAAGSRPSRHHCQSHARDRSHVPDQCPHRQRSEPPPRSLAERLYASISSCPSRPCASQLCPWCKDEIEKGIFDVQMPGLPAYGYINRPFGSILVNDENFTYIVVVGGQSWLTGANRNIHQNPCVSVQLVASLDGNSLLVKLHSVR
jgi:hypothetical protein